MGLQCFSVSAVGAFGLTKRKENSDSTGHTSSNNWTKNPCKHQESIFNDKCGFCLRGFFLSQEDVIEY